MCPKAVGNASGTFRAIDDNRSQRSPWLTKWSVALSVASRLTSTATSGLLPSADLAEKI